MLALESKTRPMVAGLSSATNKLIFWAFPSSLIRNASCGRPDTDRPSLSRTRTLRTTRSTLTDNEYDCRRPRAALRLAYGRRSHNWSGRVSVPLDRHVNKVRFPATEWNWRVLLPGLQSIRLEGNKYNRASSTALSN